MTNLRWERLRSGSRKVWREEGMSVENQKVKLNKHGKIFVTLDPVLKHCKKS